jgi:hypothetical protein
MYMRGSDEEKLDALFHAFREACPDPEASANFMPDLWQKIEARQSLTFSFGRMASAFVTAALAASLALGIYLALPGNSTYYSQSYVEALAADRGADGADVYEAIHYEVR